MTIAHCEDAANDRSVADASELESRSVHRASSKRRDGADLYTNKKIYLKRFAQSWKYYAKANDIAKREKLRKALLDALKSMNSKKKTKMTSLSKDSVNRIQHAAHMLKEFKRMYKLSNDVLNTWKDYDTARKSLIDIGQTKEGGDILKKYVTLRERISNNIKRSAIARPTIVDDQDIDENIAKDNIARHGEVLSAGGVTVQRAMTPGTLQIIRSPTKHRTAWAQKRTNLFSDAKEAARTAYSKAKEAINALKEKLKGIASADKEKTKVEQKSNETNDRGTNKKSVLAENNEMKGQSLGHVNAEMALTGMIKKAEKEDLARINQHTRTDNLPKQRAATSLHKSDKGKVETKNNEERNEKVTNESFHEIFSGSKGKEKEEMKKKEAKSGPTTSISSLMDSLAGGEDGLEKPTNSLIKATHDTAKPLNEEAVSTAATHTNPLYVDSAETKRNTTKAAGAAGAEISNQTNTKVDNMNGTANITPASSNTSEKLALQGSKTATFVQISSHTTEQKMFKVSSTPLADQVVNRTTPLAGQVGNGTAAQETNVTANKTKSGVTSGSKRFQLNDLKIQEQAVKTIDRQLETLKRLQEAKRARKRYDNAKHELQDKIKKLYDMAVSFEKPINEALMSTKTNIDPHPTKDDHPGAALAGISDKPVKVVKTPGDDGEHHGFTLGAMDSNALGKAHIVDLDEEKEKPVTKVYQIGLGNIDVGSERKSEKGDRALKSLTEAIKSDLNKIELNQFEQAKAKKHSEEIKKALEPLISEIGTVKDKSDAAVRNSETNEKPTKTAAAETTAMAEKKDKKAMSSTAGEDESVSKAQDAFKEVEDYLSKALKHVAKEAINEDESSSKDTDTKENSGIVREDAAESGTQKGTQSPTERIQVTNPTSNNKGGSNEQETEAKSSAKTGQANNEKKVETKEKDSENDKEKKNEKDMDKNERLRKIVEDAMKEHAKDPKNPHPINADLLKPTSKVAEEAKKTKPSDSINTGEKKPTDQKSNAVPTASAQPGGDGTIQRSPNDAIGKAEHLEEQVAQLQDKLYSQGTQNDAYKTIDNVEDKPLFSQDANPVEQQQPVFQDHVHHHSHSRHHHSPYDEDEEEEQESPYYRDGSERGYDDDEDDDDGNDDEDEDQREDYDDDEGEEDRRRKKSYLQQYSWRRPLQYRNYQRDRILSKQTQQQPQAEQKPLMNEGMMGNEERDELEDMKKSTVPKLAVRQKNYGIIRRGNKMYIL